MRPTPCSPTPCSPATHVRAIMSVAIVLLGACAGGGDGEPNGLPSSVVVSATTPINVATTAPAVTSTTTETTSTTAGGTASTTTSTGAESNGTSRPADGSDTRPTDVGPVATTPASAFADVQFWQPEFVTVSPGPVEMAYVDVGPRDGPTVLLLHGNPAWSYYYREVIESLVERGYRVVAPDLIGFGRSDKPLERAAHTYENHIDWIRDLVTELDLRDVILHAHDWGGLIGLRVVPLEVDRFAAVGVANTGLPDGDPLPPGFARWQRNAQQIESFSEVIDRGSTRQLTELELATFDAPWPVDELTAAPRQMPLEVPFDNDPQAAQNAEALEFWATWDRPFAVMFAAGPSSGAPGIDPVEFASLVPGVLPGQPQIVEGVGHYLHLDVADLVVEQIEALRS